MENDVTVIGNPEDITKITASDSTMSLVKALIFDTTYTESSVGPGESRQLDDEDYFSTTAIGKEIIVPPIDPVKWAVVPDNSTRVSTCINIWVQNVPGMGWEIVPEDLSGETIELSKLSGKDLQKFNNEKDELMEFFGNCNDEMTFTGVMKLVIKDRESIGTGYLECVRSARGRLVSLYHIPGYTVRSLAKQPGFVQRSGLAANLDGAYMEGGSLDKIYFKKFGDRTPMNKNTGDQGDGKPVSIKKQASELIPFLIYSSRSRYYGVPRYFPCAPSIAGSRLAAERNVVFFDNDAVPRGILFVTGGKVDAESMRRIEQFISAKAKGVQNYGRLLLIQAEPMKVGLDSTNKVDMKFEPLTVGSTEDGQFLKYTARNDNEIREAFGISETFLVASAATRAGSEISKDITNFQQFEPDRIELEHKINNTIVKDPYWANAPFKFARFKFRRPTIYDPVDKARVDTIYASAGALTVNELRTSIGKDPLPDSVPYANLPLSVYLADLQYTGMGEPPTDTAGVTKPSEAKPSKASNMAKPPSRKARESANLRNYQKDIEDITKDIDNT